MRVREFGGPQKLVVEDIERPEPAAGEVLVEVYAAGVGPWDAWIRSGRSALPQPLPLTPGSDISGVVVATRHVGLEAGQAVFGATNSRFTGGYAQYAVATAGMLAVKPARLTHIEAASVPVVAVTAKQMLFKHAKLTSGQSVLILGATGNVGGYAVQLAGLAGQKVHTSFDPDLKGRMDAVLDLVGGAKQTESFAYLRPGGILVSAVSEPDQELARTHSVRALFFLVDVNTAELEYLTDLLQDGRLQTQVAEVLPLDEVRQAHEMLDGSRPKHPGKIVLNLKCDPGEQQELPKSQ